MRGLYVHIPFCVHKCDYCDFYSLAGRQESIDDYCLALVAEGAEYGKLRFETLFIGGGTPSLLGVSKLRKLMRSLAVLFRISDLREATLEANPESANLELLRAALDCGLNRISIGVQSLADAELQKVGRIHNARKAMHALEAAQKAGFKNISADVIAGLPGQNEQSLITTLETLIGLDLAHISLYCLAVEPHTPLALHPPVDLPSDDVQAELYAGAVNLLKQRGFSHYEVSNFARPGFECRHNLNYWRAGEYIGLGPAAASYYKGCRYKNKADLDSYLSAPTAQRDEWEKLTRPQKAAEEAILRLRLLQEGLDLPGLIKKYGDQNVIGLASRLNQLSIQSHLLRDNGTYRLNPQEVLVSNSILCELMGE